MFGYIYILSNPYMPGVVKIGRTERDPNERISEISSATGVPAPFVLEYSVFVPDLEMAEKEIHVALSGNRVDDNREFFKLSVEQAKEAVRNKAVDILASQLLQYEDEALLRLIDFIFIKRKAVRDHFR
jgi:hypothetical protein